MGNEMGNANVSGLQEQETGESEAANKSSEVLVAAINEKSVNSEKQPVSLPEEEDYHDRDKDLISVDSSGLGETDTRVKLSAKLDVTEEQESDESLTNLLISNDLHDKANELLLTSEGASGDENPSATDKESAEANGIEEQGTTTTQLASNDIYDEAVEQGIAASQLASNNIYDEAAQSTLSSEDGRLQEKDSASDMHLTKDFDFEIQKPTSVEEGAKLINSSPNVISTTLNSEVMVSKGQDSDQLPVNFGDELYVEDEGILQRSDPDDLQVTGIPHSDEKSKEDEETEHMLDGSASSPSIPEVERHEDGVQAEGENSQKDTLLGMSKPGEIKLEIESGDDDGETVEPALHVENGEAREPLKAEFERKEVVELTASVESLRVGSSQSEDKFVVVTAETNSSDESGSEQKKDILDLVALSESEEESEVDMTKDHNSEPLVIRVGHEGDSRLMEIGKMNKDAVVADLQTSEEKEIRTVDNVTSHENLSSVCEKDLYMENGQEMLGEVSAFPTDITGMDTNSVGVKVSTCSLPLQGSAVEQAVAGKGELQDQDFTKKDAEETEIVKSVSIDVIPDNTHFLPSPETQSPNVQQNLTLMPTDTLENSRNSNLEMKKDSFGEVGAGYTSNLPAEISRDGTSMKSKILAISADQFQGQEQISTGGSTTGHDSNMVVGSPDSNESYNTAYELDDFNPYMDSGRKPSFNFDDQTVEAVVTDIVVDLNHQTEISKEGGTGNIKQNPVHYEEKTISGEVFICNRSDTEIYASKVGVPLGSPGAKYISSALKEDKGHFAENVTEDQITEEKQVITLGRTSSAKFDTPLLSFLKEDNYLLGPQQKQERLAAKKTIEEKWKSRDEKMTGTIPQSGAKRKPKPLFFNICMCCTTEIP